MRLKYLLFAAILFASCKKETCLKCTTYYTDGDSTNYAVRDEQVCGNTAEYEKANSGFEWIPGKGGRAIHTECR